MAVKSDEELGRAAFIRALHGRREHAPTGRIERGPAASRPTTAEALAKADADFAAGVAAFQRVLGKV